MCYIQKGDPQLIFETDQLILHILSKLQVQRTERLIGSSACHIAVSQIQKRKAVDVELYINDDKELFKSLFAYKDEIEKNMEMELEWKELPERKASRILIEKTVDLDDRATWPEQFDYIMDTCIKMKRAFKRYL